MGQRKTPGRRSLVGRVLIAQRRRQVGGVATLDGVAFCLHCRTWVTVTAASLCTCGAFVALGPIPPAFVRCTK